MVILYYNFMKLLARIFGKITHILRQNNLHQKTFYPIVRWTGIIEVKLKMQYIKGKYGEVIEEHVDINSDYADLIEPLTNIWVCWLQGMKNAPAIIKGCIERIQELNQDRHVHIITDENLVSFIDIPQYILEGHKKKKISSAAYSDFIRVALLNKYGGIWIDATIYLWENLPNAFFTSSFYTLKQNRELFRSYRLPIIFEIIGARWNAFLFSSEKNGPLVNFMYHFYCEYWKYEKEIIDYLLVDYLFCIFCEKNMAFNQYIESLQEYPLNFMNLQNNINLDTNSCIKVLNKDHFKIYKVTYKNKYDAYTTDGMPTFYYDYFQNRSINA